MPQVQVTPVPKDPSLRVFIREGQVYTSPTRIQLPPCPPSHDTPDAAGIPPSSTWVHCMWSKTDHLELAFYPTSTRLVGSAFRCLAFYRQDMIPMEVRQQQLGVPMYRTPFADEWMKLEETLIRVRNLLQHHRIAPVLVSLEKRNVQEPSTEGYEVWLTNREAAQRKTFFARRKFLYEIALISFHIAALWYRSKDPHLWYHYLMENGVPGPLLDSLSASVVADFTPNTPRAGLFMNPDACLWVVNYLPILTIAKVPIFVCWGPEGSRVRAPEGLLSLEPTDEDVLAAQRLSKPIVDTAAASSSSYDPSSGKPPDFLSTDTPGKFFAARAVYRAARIRTESEEQKRGRLSREKHAAEYIITKQGEDKVFEWDFDWEHMRWKRVRILRGNYVSTWTGYDNKYKRYDSVAKEWDLAYFFDDSPENSPRDSDQVDEQEANDRSSNPLFREADYKLAPPHPPDPSIPPRRGRDHDEVPMEDVQDSGNDRISTLPSAITTPSPRLPATFTPSVSTATTSWLPNAPTAWMSHERTAPTTSGPQEVGQISIDNGEWCPRFSTLIAVLISRHLFRWGASLDDLPTLSENQLVTLTNACKAVGFHATPEVTDALEKDKPRGVNAFVRWVSCMVLNIHPPVDWWLLSPASPSKLRDLLRTNDIRIFHLEDPHDDRKLRMWCLDDRNNGRYKRTWFVAVENPSTALAAALSHRSIDEAVKWMTTSGMQFRTLVYSPRSSYEVKQGLKMVDPHLNHHLLRRHTNYAFHAADFHAYEEVRDHFLQANPRIGRAALLAGGIIWRLAIESVKPGLVLDGPSALKAVSGITFALRDHADDVFIDDCLAPQEIQIIVGAYTREPLYRNNLEGTGFPSWWPDDRHFEGSSLDFGWWSPVTEEWYCELRAKYRKGSAQPKTGPQWRSTMRNRDKRARVFTEYSKQAASAFLRGIST